MLDFWNRLTSPRRPQDIPLVRLSLELSEDMDNLLGHVAYVNATTKSDVLRKAIALAAVAQWAKLNGQHLAVIDASTGLIVSRIVEP